MEKVYFVSAPGRIKIGFTRSPEKRLTALRNADMEELTVLAIIDGPRALEQKLHQLLTAHRLRREWFVDCPEVRLVIDEAIAGKHKVERETIADISDESPAPFSPEFQIVQRLIDEVHAALDREDDKSQVAGRVLSLAAAVEVFAYHKHLHLADPPK